jgi:hypothetical protein
MNSTRMQAIDADDLLQRVVDKIMLRRKARKTDAPGDLSEHYAGEIS